MTGEPTQVAYVAAQPFTVSILAANFDFAALGADELRVTLYKNGNPIFLALLDAGSSLLTALPTPVSYAAGDTFALSVQTTVTTTPAVYTTMVLG